MVGQMRHAVHQGVAKDKVCSWFAIFSKNPRSKFLIINDIRRRARGLGFGSESVRGMVIDGLVRCPKAGPKQRPDGEDSVMTESHRHPADPFLKETRRGKKRGIIFASSSCQLSLTVLEQSSCCGHGAFHTQMHRKHVFCWRGKIEG